MVALGKSAIIKELYFICLFLSSELQNSYNGEQPGKKLTYHITLIHDFNYSSFRFSLASIYSVNLILDTRSCSVVCLHANDTRYTPQTV